MSAGAQRIDKWLWCARFLKSRNLAARLVESGSVRLSRNGVTLRVDKSSARIMPGDTLVILLRGQLLVLRIEGLAETRVSAMEASRLYSRLQDATPKSAPDTALDQSTAS